MKRWLTSLWERLLDAVCDELAPKIAHNVANTAIAEATRTLSCQLLAESAARARAEKLAAKNADLAQRAELYLAPIPASDDEIHWTKDDSKQLASLLETHAGKRFKEHLANRLADYERAAVVMGTPEDAYALCERARGFRDCRAELLRLSAAGPSPANHEAPDFALPADLENLRA